VSIRIAPSKCTEQSDLTDVTLPPRVPRTLRLTAVRTDSEDCEATVRWLDPGFEGPGHGPFRFRFILPDDGL
jgi:hypothetical protein